MPSLKAEGVLELTPVMCSTDYTKTEYGNVKLIRTQTLDEGGDCCDFWLLLKKK